MITTNINEAVEVLKAEGVIGMPTETVYGLAGSAFSEKAIRNIYKIKNRPSENPLIVHVASEDNLMDIVNFIPGELKLLMKYFSPGPITFLLPKTNKIIDLITSGSPNVAIRIPSHSVAQELLQKVNIPLVAPSANPFQRISPINACQVDKYFEKENLLTLEGGISKFGVESTIVGFDSGKVNLYREGFVTQVEIEKVLNTSIVDKSKSKIIEAPGMYKKHYAPNCDMIIAEDWEKEIGRWKAKKIGLITLNSTNVNVFHKIHLSKKNSTKEALTNLYSALHEMENKKVDLIITHLFPNDEYGSILNDRIYKASAK